MAVYGLILLGVLGIAAAAPFRSVETQCGATIYYGEQHPPQISPPSVCINPPSPPCTGPVTVYTPPAPGPAQANPCPPAPCPPPPCQQMW